MRHLAPALFAIVLLFVPSAGKAAESDPRRAIALIDFHYSDTSGEPRDQRAEHEARLKSFMAALEQDLAASPNIRLVVPSCASAPCALGAASVAEIAAAARLAGAELLLVGGVHKMSTLVQWARIELIDLRTERVVHERLYSFRGDNDEAWRRAENFIAGEVVALPPS